MSNNYYERKRQGEIQRGDIRICTCDEGHWCSECDRSRFPKPSGNSMIFTGNTVDYDLAKMLSDEFDK